MSDGILEQLDWWHHDGIGIAMINDWSRNRFYDTCIKETVRDKSCIDVGFGTGILSLLALRHGAKHVTAFESDPARYEFGRLIIDHLGIADKITLHPQRYSHKNQQDFPGHELLISETFSTSLWGEGFFEVIPRNNLLKVIPDRCFLEIYAVEVSHGLVNKLRTEFHDPDVFDPLVETNSDFVDYINRVIDQHWRDRSLDAISLVRSKWAKQILSKKHENVIDVTSRPNEIKDIYRRILSCLTEPIAFYEVDTSTLATRTWSHGKSQTVEIDHKDPGVCISLEVPRIDEPQLLAVRTGISFKDHRLYFDNTGCWDIPEFFVADPGTTGVCFQQKFTKNTRYHFSAAH